jgi:MFS family permease
MCLFGASAPAGFVIGAVMASLFAQLMSWEWAYFVLGAVCVTLACQSIIVLPADHTPPKKMGVRYVELLDAPGMILGTSGLALIAFAWNEAPVAGWNTPYIYFLLIIGMLLLAGFLYVESRSKYALLPTAAINVTTIFILACTTVGWGCFSAWVFYTFQFLIVLRHWSPLIASASFAGIPLVGLLASILVAFLLRRVTPYRVMLVAMAAFLAGSALMAFAPVDQIFWIQTFLSIILIPIGMNVSTPVAAVLVSNAVPREHQGIATSLVTAAIFTSVAVSLGIAGTIESYVNDGGKDVEKGYRGALWFAMGMAALGLVLAAVAALADTLWPAEPEEGAALHIGKRKGKERPKRKSLAVEVSP